MGVKNIGCCYFFVFTFQGFISIYVNFDKEFWHNMLERLNWFWRKYVAPEMLTTSLKEKIKKVYSENDIIFIERESTHTVSELAQSGKCDDSELTNTILSKDIIDIEIMGDM